MSAVVTSKSPGSMYEYDKMSTWFLCSINLSCCPLPIEFRSRRMSRAISQRLFSRQASSKCRACCKNSHKSCFLFATFVVKVEK